MTTSDNIAAISKSLEGGYWAANVYDCRPPRSRRDNPLKHSRIITVHGKFATEVEALSAGAEAIKNGWTGSCIIDRDSATHSATFELDRRAVSDLARTLPALLAEARKAEAMKREIAEKDAEIARLRRLATDRKYMQEAYRNMLGPKGLEVATTWERNGVIRFHTDWEPGAAALTGEDRAQVLLDVEEAVSQPIDFLDSNVETSDFRARTLLNGGSDAQG